MVVWAYYYIYIRDREKCFQGKRSTNCCTILLNWFCICIFTTVCVLFFSHFFRSLSPLPQQTQIGLAMVAVSTLVISGIVSYTALCVTAWGYGLALGCYRYTLKMLALERVRAKHFTKAWGKYKYTQHKYTSTICPMLSFSSWFTFP